MGRGPDPGCRSPSRILAAPLRPPSIGAPFGTAQELIVYFYELHEGDDDLFTDLLLARETEMDADVFFDIVQTIRRRVQDSFEHDTLIEAIGEELERDYEFIAIDDDRLVAAVSVGPKEADNFIAELTPPEDDGLEEEDLNDGATDGEFRSLYVDVEPNPDLRTH
jgi:hypothetical protein